MKPKVVFLLQVPPPVHGAALRNLSLVESPLLRSRFDITLIPLRFANEIRDIGSVSVLKLWRLVAVLWRLIIVLATRRPDFIYFSLSPVGNAFYRDVLIVALIRLFGVPRIYHLRGIGVRGAREKALNRALYRFVFKDSYVVLLANMQSADIAGLDYKRAFIVPNGIKREIDPRPFAARERPKLLYLSNYIRSKGVIDFIEACRQLRDRGVAFSATTIGAPWDVNLEELSALVEKYDLRSHVTLAGPLFGAEKFLAIRDADVFAFPTFMSWELFPGVILEAMQCAVPVVSTPTGAIPEIITDGVDGFVTPVKNPSALADKLELLILDPALRKRVGEAALRKFDEHFTLERFEMRMCEVFDAVGRAESVAETGAAG